MRDAVESGKLDEPLVAPTRAASLVLLVLWPIVSYRQPCDLMTVAGSDGLYCELD
jgi:hypothetical protein